VSIHWFTVYLFTQTFPFILASLTLFGTFYVYVAINLSAGLFYLFVLPETKVNFMCLDYSHMYFISQDISLESMEKLFDKPWLERVGLCQCSR